MNSWKVIPTIVLATVLIFGTGVFTGGLLVNYVKTTRPKKIAKVEIPAANAPALVAPTNFPTPAPAKPASRLPEILSKEFLQRLDLELRLTPEQHEAVQKIIADGQSSTRKMMNAARLEIREVLTAEQQKQFDSLVKKQPKKSAPVPATNTVPSIVTATNAP